MNILKVADKLSNTFYVDTDACPWVAEALERGELRELEQDRAPRAKQVIRGAEVTVRLTGGHEMLVDFSKSCNWLVAAEVSAQQAQIVG